MSYSTSLTTRKSFRDSIANTLVSMGKPVYQILRYRRKPWNLNVEELHKHPENSLEKELASFLKENQFELMPRAEFHDVYHVLFGYGTTMREETSIQFIVIGNGHWSLPNLVSSGVALVFYPENWGEYRKAYQKGIAAKQFHHQDFRELLDENVAELKERFKLA